MVDGLSDLDYKQFFEMGIPGRIQKTLIPAEAL